MGKITTILADRREPGKVYIGTETDSLYYGKFGDEAGRMKHTPKGRGTRMCSALF